MKLSDISLLAEGCLSVLAPSCERIAIAGSIRRRCPNCKDIEVVCIPRARALFGFAAAVHRWVKIKGEPTGRYTQRRLPSGVTLDLFIATPENWGAIFLIRTGDWRFSKRFMGSLLPSRGYQQKHGYVWKDGVMVPAREESDLFGFAGIDFIDPHKRIG